MPVNDGNAGQVGERRRLGARQRGADRATAYLGLDLRGRAVGNDMASSQQDDPVSERVGLLEVVSGEDDCLPAGRDRAHRRPEFTPTLDVEGRRRLIEQKEVGVGHEGDGEANSLALPAGQSVGTAIGEGRCAAELQRLTHGQRARVDRGDHGDQFADAQVLDQRAGLQHAADEACGDRRCRRAAEERDPACVGPGESQHHVDRRRLAGPVRTEEREELALGDLETHVVDRRQRSVPFGHMLDDDSVRRVFSGVGGHRGPSGSWDRCSQRATDRAFGASARGWNFAPRPPFSPGQSSLHPGVEAVHHPGADVGGRRFVLEFMW